MARRPTPLGTLPPISSTLTTIKAKRVTDLTASTKGGARAPHTIQRVKKRIAASYHHDGSNAIKSSVLISVGFFTRIDLLARNEREREMEQDPPVCIFRDGRRTSASRFSTGSRVTPWETTKKKLLNRNHRPQSQ